METHSKYHSLLAPLLQKPHFTAAEARALGVPSRALSYLMDRGLLERLARGIYRNINYEPEVEVLFENLASVASTVPNAVICLISALQYYGYTEELVRQHWIAIPHGRHPAKRSHARVVQMRNTTTGRETIQLGEYRVSIFNRERCIVDAFRYLSIEVAIKALRAYLHDPSYKSDLRKLSQYARQFRVNLTPYILAETT